MTLTDCKLSEIEAECDGYAMTEDNNKTVKTLKFSDVQVLLRDIWDKIEFEKAPTYNRNYDEGFNDGLYKAQTIIEEIIDLYKGAENAVQ